MGYGYENDVEMEKARLSCGVLEMNCPEGRHKTCDSCHQLKQKITELEFSLREKIAQIEAREILINDLLEKQGK